MTVNEAATLADVERELDAHPVSITYRGRVGCGCGCRGTYSDKLVSLTKRRNELLAWVRTGTAERVTVWSDMYVSAERNGSVITLYTDGRGL